MLVSSRVSTLTQTSVGKVTSRTDHKKKLFHIHAQTENLGTRLVKPRKQNLAESLRPSTCSFSLTLTVFFGCFNRSLIYIYSKLRRTATTLLIIDVIMALNPCDKAPGFIPRRTFPAILINLPALRKIRFAFLVVNLHVGRQCEFCFEVSILNYGICEES